MIFLTRTHIVTGRTVQVRLPSGSNYNQFLQLAVQAAFDWVFYESTNSVRLSVIPTSELQKFTWMEMGYHYHVVCKIRNNNVCMAWVNAH